MPLALLVSERISVRFDAELRRGVSQFMQDWKRANGEEISPSAAIRMLCARGLAAATLKFADLPAATERREGMRAGRAEFERALQTALSKGGT